MMWTKEKVSATAAPSEGQSQQLYSIAFVHNILKTKNVEKVSREGIFVTGDDFCLREENSLNTDDSLNSNVNLDCSSSLNKKNPNLSVQEAISNSVFLTKTIKITRES